MLTNLQLPVGYVGPGTFAPPVSANPGGALLFVLSTIGADGRGRVTFPGTAASTTASASAQGPYGDPNKPLASVFGTNGALSYLTAGRGDIVVVLPGHSENLANNSAYSVPAGVTILGIGYGPSRPLFAFTGGTTTSISLGAGARIDNVQIQAVAVDATTNMIAMAAGSQFCNSRLIMADATNQATSGITVNGNDVLIVDNDIDAELSAGAATAIASGAAIQRLKVVGNNIHGNFSTAIFSSTSTNHITQMLVGNNTLTQRNGTAKNVFNFTTSSTGLIVNNSCIGTTWTTAADVASNSSSTSLRWVQNFGFDDGAGVVSGVLVPAAGTIG